MALFETILKQVQSVQSMRSRNSSWTVRSPPPELKVIEVLEKEIKGKRRRRREKFANVRSMVDNSPPSYHVRYMFRKLPDWASKRRNLDNENIDMVLAIKRTHFTRGRVDSRWKVPPKPVLWAYYNRLNAAKRISADNKVIYKRLATQGPKVVTTDSLMRDWARNRESIIHNAQMEFILFPPIPHELIEDPAFLKPDGVKRPRVFFTLHFDGGYNLGTLEAELFTDICPNTSTLFMELLAGDGVGFSYVGTHFFKKIPHLYWAGGDVACDNGFGCYAQRGRRIPIGAENYHFSHTMPGLLSMSVTRDNEMCGIFNITFKALPQLDLTNVVFGRIVRPSHVFNAMSHIGKLLSTRPTVRLSASRLRLGGKWVHGTTNTRMMSPEIPRIRSR